MTTMKICKGITIVTHNGDRHIFADVKTALEFIFKIKGGVNNVNLPSI